MNRFSWYKALGFGVLIWAIGGMALWILSVAPLSTGWAHGIVAVIIGMSAYFFALNANPQNVKQALGYGVVFALLGLVFDAVITKIFDEHVFTIWQYYLGYGLVLFAPLFRSERFGDQVLSS